MYQVSMKVYFVATTLLVCLVLAAAQQQQQPADVIAPPAPPTPTPTPADQCASVTTKPSPATTSYVFNTCIVAKFAAYLSIDDGKFVEFKNGVVSTNLSRCNVPNDTSVTPQLVVDFGTCGQLQFEIGKQVNGTGVYVKAINGFYKIGNTTNQFSNSTGLFHTTQSGHYYKCNTEQPIILNKKDNILMLSNFAYEAYRDATGTDFYQIPEECALDSSQVSDLVRIGVGICLVALVVIVLIAYFVGRRRWSERSSYESV